jgi:flagellar hook-associated protein 3 FlgL
MSSVIPVPSTRVSNLLIRQRLTSQLQGDQLDIFRLQNQISTGRRISLPSEDAPAAQRAITLQRLIERKAQLSSNVKTGQSFLAATDSALSEVATRLGAIRGEALGAASTTATDQQRLETANEVDDLTNELINVANQRYRGRYLFAGSQTNIKPYSREGTSVQYAGDEKLIQNFSDLDVLFPTNAPGTSVFGGISEEVVGGIDLNPHLSSETLLSSLRGGRGISSNGALLISDGANSVTVDVSHAVTVGDVVRQIEENPPPGRRITASVTGSGLTLQLDAVGGGNLSVTEVGSGRAAHELGIYNPVGVLTGPLAGSDLDPKILKTTRIEDLLGTKARARITSAGDNNDLLIEANANGVGDNGITIQFVDDVAAGAESATYAAGTLTVHIAAGASSANAVVNAVNAQGLFTATLDPTDSLNPSQAGSGAVSVASTAVTSGGSGTTLDLASGIRVQNGGQSTAIDFSTAETVEDLLNLLNGSDAGLAASINAAGTGIDVRSRLSGSDFQIGENGGTTATQLGLRTYDREVRLEDLNYGVGVPTNEDRTLTIGSSQLAITTRSGGLINVDLTSAATQADVIAAINLAAGANVTAQPAAGGSGIRLIDHTIGATPLAIVQSGAALPITGGIATQIESPDFSITTRNGQGFNVDVSGAETIGEVIDAINAAAGGSVTARLATTGNGLELVDNTVGAGQLTVDKLETSQAAEYLGLIPKGSTQATTASGTFVGADQNFKETSSVFTTLLRLRDALLANDPAAIGRATARIDDDINRASFARAEVGAREQALDIATQNLQDEDVQLQSALSGEIEVDLVEAISNLSARQVSLQASLQSIGNILQLSLLDYI